MVVTMGNLPHPRKKVNLGNHKCIILLHLLSKFINSYISMIFGFARGSAHLPNEGTPSKTPLLPKPIPSSPLIPTPFDLIFKQTDIFKNNTFLISIA